MNIPAIEGESSSKRQENGDSSSGSDRPLKKARFAWQVKGKYHLKNEKVEKISPSTSNDDSEATISSLEGDNDTNDLVGNAEQNLEILGDYLLKQDFNTLDSVITDSEKSLIKPCPAVTPDRYSYPKYIASHCANGLPSHAYSTRSNNESFAVPMSLVQAFGEDQCIARWQARQMAKGFVDNTINRVLDSWMVAPIPAEADNRILALDVAEFINNLPGDNSIENEGILMAISAHGLQNAPNISSSSKEVCLQSDQNLPKPRNKHVYPSPPSSPVSSDDEMAPETNKFEDNWNDSKEMTLTDNHSIEPYTPYNSFPEIQDSSENDINIGRYNNYYDENVNSESDIYANHLEFMDAAVSFAIQNKGLTSHGTEYG